MKWYNKQNVDEVLWHTVAIIVFILCEMGVILIYESNVSLCVLAIYYAMDIGFFYLSSYFYIPRIFKLDNRLIYKILYYFIWILLISLIIGSVSTAFQVNFFGFPISDKQIWFSNYKIFWRSVYLFVLALAFWYARHVIKKEREAKEKEREMLQHIEREMRLENALLRSQVNPHLMYNTLAGIHNHLFTKVPEAAELILLLADIMEYAVEASNAEQPTTLMKEIIHISLLLKLQQALHNNELQVIFTADIPDHVADKEVPPLIFTNFVDNVFKHGLITDPAQPARIRLDYHEGILEFSTSNAIAALHRVKPHGVGMRNSRERLERHFPNRYNLTQYNDDNTYYLTLSLMI